MARRQVFINEGAQDVVIIAVWLKDLPNVYSAYDVAHALQFSGRQLGQDRDEILVCGGIFADSYRILALFRGILPPEDIAISLPGLRFEVRVPGNFVLGIGDHCHCYSTPQRRNKRASSGGAEPHWSGRR